MNNQHYLFETGVNRGADFSECRNFRYALWVDWDDPDNRVAFCCLNPSTADEIDNDPTVTRCINFAKRWGFGGFVMLNAYAFRATDPKNMKLGRRFDNSPIVTNDPVGPRNDEALHQYSRQAKCVVVGWGNHITPDRQRQVVDVLDGPLFCLAVNANGTPGHPLYLPASSQRKRFSLP